MSTDDLDPLMPIGMFSRASLVSIKALRSYHELGLLVPDSVDPSTGYRSYRTSQLADAAVVKRLRDLDMPLASILEIVGARDPDLTRRVIDEHMSRMRDRLHDVARIVDELQSASEHPAGHTPVHERVEPPVHALAVHGDVDRDDYGDFLGDAFARLFDAVGRVGAELVGPSGARYPATVESDGGPVEAFLPIREPVPVPRPVQDLGVVLTLIPEAVCAVATHLGGYDTIGETYRRLGAWVARNAEHAEQAVREHYVVSIGPDGRLLPDDRLRTEISWPIHPSTPTHGA